MLIIQPFQVLSAPTTQTGPFNIQVLGHFCQTATAQNQLHGIFFELGTILPPRGFFHLVSHSIFSPRCLPVFGAGSVFVRVNGTDFHALLPEGLSAGSSVELKPVRLGMLPGSPVRLRYDRLRNASAFLSYQLESSASPWGSAWSEFSAPSITQPGEGGWEPVEVLIPPTEDNRFYRLRIFKN